MQSPPPHGSLSILQHLISAYKAWFEFKKEIKKPAKYTLAEKVDTLFIETLELIFAAQYAKAEQRLPILQKANTKFDALKFFLQILWETKNMNEKHYATLSTKLAEIGKMLGGWLRRFDTAVPTATKN